MTSVPVINVFNPDDTTKVQEGKIALPQIFKAPIRLDIVQFVHSNISKNIRQAHGVDKNAGMKHSAESWGTGRAVARIPRVSGSGTHRSGQGAFANSVRKGRMFAPLKTWRRWHRKVNLKQKRHAVASAIAASAYTPLVMARGHRIENVPEIPLVVDDKLESYEKTKDAIGFLKRLGVLPDIEKVKDTKKLRAGKGKMRNKRYYLRKGPLVIYSNENAKLALAFRNIPGVDTCNVHRMNLKQLAPGGQLGRLIIWTKGAILELNKIFGTFKKDGVLKSEYALQKSLLTNADISRIINSNEIQEAIKPREKNVTKHMIQKKNPLKNINFMKSLNPNAILEKQKEALANKDRKEKRKALLDQKRGITKSLTKEQKDKKKNCKKNSMKWIKDISQNIDDSALRDKKIESEDKDIRVEAV